VEWWFVTPQLKMKPLYAARQNQRRAAGKASGVMEGGPGGGGWEGPDTAGVFTAGHPADRYWHRHRRE